MVKQRDGMHYGGELLWWWSWAIAEVESEWFDKFYFLSLEAEESAIREELNQAAKIGGTVQELDAGSSFQGVGAA